MRRGFVIVIVLIAAEIALLLLSLGLVFRAKISNGWVRNRKRWKVQRECLGTFVCIAGRLWGLKPTIMREA